ncbi:hypothetical protein CAAN1_06S00342 [[Candida] anglica]|uniref:FAD/NAD(P)-binding domain-containing protein n=1 Tax=[Candida] anglica TaxID=148631 RepID=A0ABP0EN63_9ASCO
MLSSSNEPVEIKTKVLVVGGAYAGLAAVRALTTRWRESQDRIKECESGTLPDNKKTLSITFVEPKSGLLNILGIPKAIINSEFAKTQYVPFEDTKLQINRVISGDETVIERFKTRKNVIDFKFDDSVEVTYVQGKVTHLTETDAEYTLEHEGTKNGDKSGKINFEYVILASGRDRNWPTTPDGFTPESYADEMNKFKKSVENQDIVTIIGAGAVGLEVAGDIKHEFPDKTVNLIHPHSTFPPEPLTAEFKAMVLDSVTRGGVKVHLNTRISEELPSGDLVTTTGEIIKSGCNFWSTSHKNNVELLCGSLKVQFVNKQQNILVNEFLQLTNATRQVGNFFVLGDLVELPIIKSAGWAMYMGRAAANNVISLINNGELVEPLPDLAVMPRGMVVVAGNGDIVSEIMGVAELNIPGYVEEYKDYCLGKILATLDI